MGEQTNLVVGRGRVYFDPHDADGNPTGEIYLGNTPQFDLSQAEEVIDSIDSVNGIRALRQRRATIKRYTVSIGTDNMTSLALALYMTALSRQEIIVLASEITETYTVRLGRHYQLGQSVRPSGLRNLQSLEVTKGATVINFDRNFRIDALRGRLQVRSDSADLDELDSISCVFTVGEATPHVVSGMFEREGAVRFVSDNLIGAQRDVFIPCARLAGSGTVNFKAEAWQAVSLTAEVLRPNPAVEPFYIETGFDGSNFGDSDGVTNITDDFDDIDDEPTLIDDFGG